MLKLWNSYKRIWQTSCFSLSPFCQRRLILKQNFCLNLKTMSAPTLRFRYWKENLVTSFSICNSWSISFHNGWWKLFFIVMAINGWIIELHSNKIWSHKFSFSSLFCKVKCTIIYQTILIFSGGRYRGYRVQNKERIQQIRLNEWQKKYFVHFLLLCWEFLC